MTRVTISDMKNGALALDLRDLVPLVAEQGKNLHWTILWFQGAGEGSGELEARATKSPVRVTWNQVKDLAGRLYQTYDAVLVGTRSGTEQISLDEWESRQVTVDLALEVFDSSEWIIETNDDRIVHSILSHYPAARVEGGKK